MNDDTYKLNIEFSALDENRNMKPSSYQLLFNSLANMDLLKHGGSFDETIKYGFSWAIISIAAEISLPVHDCISLYGKTWLSDIKGPYYRREIAFYDENDKLRFTGVIFSVLIDIKTHNISRKRDLPFFITEPDKTFLIKAKPRYKCNVALTDIETRTVRPSYIDLLSHVNNCCYGDFAFDALSQEERAKMGDLKRIEYYFNSELRPNDEFTIRKAGTEDNILVSGYNENKQDDSFFINMFF